ncbi:MAG TPA: hypothetical protein VJV77_08290 [Casimicrobiaceae bacterium]|nr:hypothetical protein [Casimicrobiaceae bacterium]
MRGDAMNGGSMTLAYQQIHIDAARNATDDFNPFHDPRKAQLVRGNPFAGTIVMGFQLEGLIEHAIDLHRDAHAEHALVEQEALHFSNYQLTFANVLAPGQRFGIEIKPTIVAADRSSLANRVVIRAEATGAPLTPGVAPPTAGDTPPTPGVAPPTPASMVLLGYKRETREPLVAPDCDPSPLPALRPLPDRSFVPGTACFLKRKFLNTGNAKNFLAGSLCDQGYYFDEIAERVNFPDLFPASLLSCALLEKAQQEGHDFLADPMVYMAHTIAVDRRIARRLRSNDVLHMLVEGPEIVEGEKGLKTSGVRKLRFRCFGLVGHEEMLYRAEVLMAPLASILR